MIKQKTINMDNDYIHQWFGLSYANYLVIQRTLLQSMPDKWQKQFVKLLDELNEKCESFANELPESYYIRAKKDGKFISDEFSNYKRGTRNIFEEKETK